VNPVSRYLKPLQGNAKVCVAFHPLWSIPYAVYMFYLSLYLKEQGITDSQLGQLMMVGNIVGMVASVLSAPIVDRLGRRTTTLVFDLISSALPPLIFLTTSSYSWAFVAMVAANLNRIMSIGFYLTMIEDSSEQTNVVAMNLFNFITVAAGLVVPAAGLVVGRLGLVTAQRWFLLVSAISMTLLATVRHFLLKETTVGLHIRQQARQLRALRSKKPTVSDWLQGVDMYRQAFAYLATHPQAARALRTNILFYTYYAVGTSVSLYFTPYFTGHLALSASQASLVGGLYSAGTLAAMLLINPAYTRTNNALFMTISAAVSLVGFVLLIVAPGGAFAWVAVAVVAISVGFGMLKSATDANIAMETAGTNRSGVYAISYLVSALLSVAVLGLLSMLYASFPPWLFILSAVLMAFVVVDQSRHLARRNE